MSIEGFYEGKKFKEEQHRIEMERIKAETIKIFNGSGIIEALKKIRDSQILVFANINSSEQIISFIGSKDIPLKQTIPAKLIYDLNKVSLMYDVDFFDKNKDLPIEFEFCEITVERIDKKNFKFNGIGVDMTGNAKETRNSITNFVKKHEPFFGDDEKKRDNKALIAYSEEIDEKYCV